MPSGSDDAQQSPGETDPASVAVAGVVGIGASAGGLEALEELFGALPVDTGLAFIIVQHLSPDFKSHMDELLGRRTEMAVRVIQDGDRIAANTLYLLPPRKEVVLDQWHLRLTDKQTGGGLNLPIDRMFQSLAGHVCRRVAVVVLSGTGSDGSQGLQDVARHGGLVLCQDEHTATFDGMPLKAQATGCVDLVLAPESIAEALQRFAVMNDKVEVVRSLQEEMASTDFSGVLDELHQEYGIDFGQYKQTTVNRRLARRLARCNVEDAKHYERQLARDPHELARLYHDLLIGVTQFYRDPEAYDALERLVITPLVEQVEGDQEIRVWVAGCATGEEAYSTAMLLHEHLERAGTSATFKLFATDMHPESLRTASLGVYSEEAAETIPAARRRRFFRKTPRGYQVNKELRERIVFATHNVAGDAPFTNLDLITCRNLLIYLQDAAQERVLTHFHFSLKPGGHLFLGPSESLGALAPGFETLDAHWKLFCKSGPLPQHRVIRPRPPQVRPIRAATPKRIRPQSDRALSLSYDRLLDFFMPPSLLVDEEMMLLQVFGDADALLRISRGRISGLVQDILIEPLRTPVAAALQHARREHIPVQYGEVRVAGDSEQFLYKVTVRPIQHAAIATTHYLVQFDREAAAPKSADRPTIQLRADSAHGEISRIRSLEHELDFTRENLQATVEELETTNEELQSTNEELTSSNEELQSTNEELHSVNEELHTVNSEHQRKIIELTELTNDIENLLVSTDVGLLFLDHELRLRRFTPRIADAMRLSHEDMGRRINTFSDVLKGVNLLEESFRVLGGADPVTVEVRDDRDRPFLLQVLPYRADSRNTGVVITLVDLTLVKQAETDLRRLSSIVSGSEEGIIGHDLEGRITIWNRGAETLFGISAEQATGCQLGELLPDTLAQALHQQLEQVAAGEATEPAEVRLPAERPAEEIVLVVRVSAIVDDSGRTVSAATVIQNITPLRKAETTIRRSEEEYRSTFENAAVGIAHVGLDGRWLRVNQKLCDIVGYSRDELLCITFQEITHPDDLQKDLAQFLPMIRRERAGYSIEKRFLHKQGHEVWINLTASVRCDEQGQPRNCIFLIEDISDRKTTEYQLRKSRNLVSRVLESITEAFFSLDDDWRFTFINPAAQRLLDVDAAQLLGEPFQDVLTPQSCQLVRRRLQEVQQSQQAVRFEMELPHLQRWYDVRCFPVDGGLSVFLSDATARRETEQYLQKARRAAEQANRAKSDFLANMSHEIRTPMTAILGFSEIALRQLDAGEAVDPEHLKTVKRNGQYLLRIIDDILDLSKIEAGKLDVRISQFGLFEFIREVEKLVSFRAAQTGVPLTIELVGMLPESICTDRGRVEQILANLLGNAIKFTETGCVRLRVSYLDQAAEPQLRFEVIDTGIGIPQDKQRQLFTPFAQAHVEGFGRRFGGTGLGLSISRRLAALLGGDISLKSAEGVGSTFTLTLPVGDARQIHLVSPPEIDRLEPPHSNPGTELQQLDLRVLIADDMRDVRMVAKHFLSKSGATVTMVENGQAAVDAVQRSVEEGTPFDVILMDMQMPVMNGYEATRVLRRLGHEMPIIALTAAAMRTELSEAIQAGCDEHMTKPIHGPQLVGRVASRVHQHRQKILSSPPALRRSSSV